MEIREAQERRDAAKVSRYDILTRAWDDDITLERCATCRRVGVVAGGDVGLRAQEGAAGFSGLAKCGSVWACPVCAAKIARQRADELDTVLRWAVDQGHTVAMLTMTMQHHAGHTLKNGWNAVQAAWAACTSGRGYRGDTDRDWRIKIEGETDTEWAVKQRSYRERLESYQKAVAAGTVGKRKRPAEPRRRWGWENHGRLKGWRRPSRDYGWKGRWGVLGWARAVEVTLGEANGWHPHLHVVLVFEGQLSADMVQAAVGELFPTWQKTLQQHGFDAKEYWVNPDGSTGGALDVRVSTEETAAGLSDYFTKFAALELTGAVNKKGRNKGRTPFQLAKAAFLDGDADAHDAWAEWVKVSKGRRQLTWSEDLRELAGLSKELTDEEVAEQDLGNEDDLILPVETWTAVRWQQVHLLLAAEKAGVQGAITWLDERGLDWIQPPRSGPPS